MPADEQETARDLRRELYPAIEPRVTGRLRVSDVHELYWEECGNPNGRPVVYLHGGPGGGTTPTNRRFFDPQVFRIILFDQRGAGRSTPHACVEDNTTWDLVSDVERIREMLGIESWLVFGGSWGSTLALCYSIKHADKVQGLILRGIFLLRPKELHWLYGGGVTAAVFADFFESFRDFIPEEERHDFVAAYHKRVMDDSNPDCQAEAARRWTLWEFATSHLIPDLSDIRSADSHFQLAFARIETHYFVNNGFFSPNYILENIGAIKHLPAIIVQGRYDMVCPMASAWDLHKAWPTSHLKIVPDAGHSANERGTAEELVAAMEWFKSH